MHACAADYATGYGRLGVVKQLLGAGASPAAKNATGKTPAEVATLNPNNPLLAETELMQQLKA